MPDDLWLSGGGTTMVGTDAMFAEAHTIEIIAISLQGALAAMENAIEATRVTPIAAALATTTTADVHTAMHYCHSAHEQAQDINYALRSAMLSYGETEGAINDALELAAGAVGYVAGATVATWILALGPLGIIGAGLLPLGMRTMLDSDGKEIAPDDIESESDQIRSMSDPAFVAALAYAVSSGDEFVFGLGGVPAFLQTLLSTVDGVDGVASTAMLLSMYGSLGGLFLETPVKVERTANSFAEPVGGFEDRLERIPDPQSAPGGAQIRIDRVSLPGAPEQFEVYLAGTEDFNPVAGETPFDMTSNVAGVAGLPAGSMLAAEQAMKDAGITPDSLVTFTGHSQGALMATVLASSGDWNTAGLVTIGSPAGNIIVPPGFPAVIIEHEEDLVTALGGVQQNTDALIVRRRLWDQPSEIPTDLAVPAHRMPSYLETARLMDDAQGQQLSNAAAQLEGFSARGTVTTSYYLATRIPDGEG